MTDTTREMLELAAKAISLELWFDDNGTAWVGGDKYIWNPLDDDGDSRRLDVALKLNVFHTSGKVYAIPFHADGDIEHYVPHGDDPCAATRLAVLRVAAEIGRNM